MSLRIFEQPRELQSWSLKSKSEGKTVGFVPTMGALHEGHGRLMERSLKENDLTVVSLFVNPTQFDQPEDFEKYPQDFQKDLNFLKKLGVPAVFHPTPLSIYPEGDDIQVDERPLSTLLCGAHRPGHFQGMLTVVLKLLNIVQPTRAYFGEKDYQQLLLVKKMVNHLFLPTEILAVPTVRDEQGVALSSRNQRLNETDRLKLPQFSKLLRVASTDAEAARKLQEAGFEVDYVTTYNNFRHGAVHLGGVRFIDHVEV